MKKKKKKCRKRLLKTETVDNDDDEITNKIKKFLFSGHKFIEEAVSLGHKTQREREISGMTGNMKKTSLGRRKYIWAVVCNSNISVHT